MPRDPVAPHPLGRTDRAGHGALRGRAPAPTTTPEQGYRACLGLMRLGRRYGAARLEAASARATALGSYRYRTVTNILASAQDRLPLDAPDERPTTPPHANIRGARYYCPATEDPC